MVGQHSKVASDMHAPKFKRSMMMMMMLVVMVIYYLFSLWQVQLCQIYYGK